MGYRLDVYDAEDEKINIYGTKLYGYLDDEEFDTLLSLHYLIRLRKIEYDERFYYNLAYCYPARIRLDANQYRIFITYYIQDLQGPIYKSDSFFEYAHQCFDANTFDKLFYSGSDKLITWT